MSTLVIRKKSLKTWLHIDSVLGDFIISKFYFNADNLSFQIVEQGNSKRVIYNIADITLYDDVTGGGVETFSTIEELSLRLEELNYPAFFYDGTITSIANLISEGTNITITGDGTLLNPYVINATGGGFGTPTLAQVTAVGGREVKIVDTTLGDYTLLASDKNKILYVGYDNDIDIIIPTGIVVNFGDEFIIENGQSSNNVNFDVTGIGTGSTFNPILPFHKATITVFDNGGSDTFSIFYQTNGLAGGGSTLSDYTNSFLLMGA